MLRVSPPSWVAANLMPLTGLNELKYLYSDKHYLWDNSTGAYLDSLSDAVSHPQDGNSISVLASVSSPLRTTSLLSYLDSHALPYGNPFYDNDSLGAGFSERVYAFISYFEIQARFLSSSASTALDQFTHIRLDGKP